MADEFVAAQLLWHSKQNKYVQPGEPVDLSDYTPEQVAIAQREHLIVKALQEDGTPNPAAPKPPAPPPAAPSPTDLLKVRGIAPAHMVALRGAGINTPLALANAPAADVQRILGITPEHAEQIQQAARAHVENPNG